MVEWRALALAACLLAAPAAAVTIDGRIHAEEWAEARRITEFRKIQPLNGEPASLPTEVWVLATPEGLAVAFRAIQPPSVPRTQQRVQRDFNEQVDRVNVMVDFDGEHRTGYDFTISSTNGIFDAIITNEQQFNSDWDGNWQHEVGGDDEAWTAEVLIPWHIAPMRESAGDRRTIGIYVDRVIGVTGAGIDDLLTSGNDAVNLPPNLNSYFEYERPRVGNWAYRTEMEAYGGGLSGNHRIGYRIEVEPRYFISDALQVYIGLQAERQPDWLVWQEGTLFGSFEGRQTDLSAGFTWIMTNRHELRLKLQAIGLDAELRLAYRVDDAGNAIPTDEPVSDFSVSTLGLKIRYRYELAPLSYLYVVYGRGGFEQEDSAPGSDRLVRDSFSLRDDEQLLIKLSYRFET